MVQRKAEAIYRLMDAFNARDFDRFLDQCDPEVELYSQYAQVSGIYRGHAGLRRWHLGLIGTWEYIRLELEQLIEVDDDTFLGLVVLHPEQGYRSCLGLLRLSRRDGATRLEAACARALTVGVRSYRHVDSILKHGLDRLPPPAPAEPLPLAPVHEHVRGRDYYQ